MVGESLLPLLIQANWQVTAFSRHALEQSVNGVQWRQPLSPYEEKTIPYWICAAPIWVLPDLFALLEAHGVQRIVVLSSTSRYTKADSPDLEELATVRRLVDAEQQVSAWATSHGVESVILRPTLIYGLGRDKNVSEIARFIGRFGFFPLFGRASGLRQPVHVEDVAAASLSALNAPAATNRDYNISGGETLTYRQMVERIFAALGRRPWLIRIPLSFFRLAVACLRLLPRYRHWSAAMAERMNRDLVFNHDDATRDFGYKPRQFSLSAKDMPVQSG